MISVLQAPLVEGQLVALLPMSTTCISSSSQWVKEPDHRLGRPHARTCVCTAQSCTWVGSSSTTEATPCCSKKLLRPQNTTDGATVKVPDNWRQLGCVLMVSFFFFFFSPGCLRYKQGTANAVLSTEPMDPTETP